MTAIIRKPLAGRKLCIFFILYQSQISRSLSRSSYSPFYYVMWASNKWNFLIVFFFFYYSRKKNFIKLSLDLCVDISSSLIPMFKTVVDQLSDGIFKHTFFTHFFFFALLQVCGHGKKYLCWTRMQKIKRIICEWSERTERLQNMDFFL